MREPYPELCRDTKGLSYIEGTVSAHSAPAHPSLHPAPTACLPSLPQVESVMGLKHSKTGEGEREMEKYGAKWDVEVWKK